MTDFPLGHLAFIRVQEHMETLGRCQESERIHTKTYSKEGSKEENPVVGAVSDWQVMP